jgi:hypothetical protein
LVIPKSADINGMVFHEKIPKYAYISVFEIHT